MLDAIGSNPLVRAVPEQALADSQQALAVAAPEEALSGLAGYIRSKFQQFSSHRDSANGWNDRLLAALRAFNGQYDPTKLLQIQQFKGSEVYARLTAVKCRGATALLRDVYLGAERPWGISPTPDPTTPDDITQQAMQLVQSEVQTATAAGQPPAPEQIRDRVQSLLTAARLATKKRAAAAAQVAQDKLDDILVEGNFYRSLAEFLVDLPLFPFACIKGPVVRIVPQLRWINGQPAMANTAKMFWERVSPFDIWFTPGVSAIEDAEVLERRRLTRADLNDLIGLPGYDSDAVREVLDLYGLGGLAGDWLDSTESARAQLENRENPLFNQSGLIDCLEFHGAVQGSMLLDFGFGATQVPDSDRDYFVQAWLIGRYVIKVQFAPSPRKRHPYFITSFEKVPGTVVGNALPDVLSDLQDVCNAVLRALVNNVSIASGPQVVVNVDRLDSTGNAEDLYPWKRWLMTSDPMGSTAPPVTWFQPQMNADALLGIYEKISQIADELSAIPRYITGSDRMGGAGRTASGLAMLMGNASKILQTVASNIDIDVLNPALQGLYDMVMLTDQSGLLRGDESVDVQGVSVAVQRETERQRQLEFLTATANPLDAQIVGIEGRAAILRAVANTLGLNGESIVPSDDEIKARVAQAPPPGQPPVAQAAAQAQGGQAPAMHPSGPPATNTVQATPPTAVRAGG